MGKKSEFKKNYIRCNSLIGDDVVLIIKCPYCLHDELKNVTRKNSKMQVFRCGECNKRVKFSDARFIEVLSLAKKEEK